MLPCFYILFNCVALAGQRPSEQAPMGPRVCRGAHDCPQTCPDWTGVTLALAALRRTCFASGTEEERQFTKMVPQLGNQTWSSVLSLPQTTHVGTLFSSKPELISSETATNLDSAPKPQVHPDLAPPTLPLNTQVHSAWEQQ